jgi:ubiquinone/menaquinone biosynthesis C-methylase UbiE
MPTQLKQTDVFDVIASDYRQIHNQSIGFSGADSDHFSEQKVEIVRRLEPGNPAILDLGCGDGNSAVYFTKHFPGSEYAGIDSSSKSVQIAADRGLSNARFACYDGREIPYDTDSFDVVFTACVLHHIDRTDHEPILREAMRVLKPGGHLYIFEHNPLNPLTRKVVRDCPFDEGVVLLPAGYTRDLLESIGFNRTSVNYTVFFPRQRLVRHFLGLERYLGWLPLGGQYYARAERP